jgi:hypothetical protein
MCNSFAQWTVDGDNVTFEMEGESSGYIALGLFYPFSGRLPAFDV